MRNYLLMVILIMISTGSFAQTVIFSDDFNTGTVPDPTKWKFQNGDGCSLGLCGWGNAEKEYYTNRTQNCTIVNGALQIIARNDNAVVDGSARAYTSSKLITQGNFSFLYGTVEFSAKMPGGKGSWAGLWMLPDASAYGGWPKSGEIDVNEYVGYEPNSIHSSLHTDWYNGTNGNNPTNGGTITANAETVYHTYKAVWEPSRVRFYIDNVCIYTYRRDGYNYQSYPFDKNFFLIMNVAVGGNWGGLQGIDATKFPMIMSVDWVKITSLDPALNITQSSYGDTPISLPGKIEAENFNNGGLGVAYNDLDDVNSGGAYRQFDCQVDISAGGSNFNVGWFKPTEWLNYDVNVTSPGDYNFSMQRCSSVDATMHLEVDGVNVTGAAVIPASGDWTNYVNYNFTKVVHLTSGFHRIKMAVDASSDGENVDYLTATLAKNTTDINEIQFDNVEIYPNPVKNILTISEDFLSYQLYNTIGNELESAKLNNRQIDVNSLSSGVYILKLNSDKQTIVKRFIKQ